MGAFGWIEYLFWGAIAVGIVVRLTIALVRRRRGREALRSALRPLMDAGAVESAAYGWTPSTSTDLPAVYGSVLTGEGDDGRPRDLPDRRG
ncbi:hypothetical protein LPW41_04825 [Microbacterium sp. JC 701]|uniref:hypothetical protein n=1 Tax=Microbacterium sp. JC 701 TaxID=2897389 RepID=UPI001E3B545C|nr:hypothetical protein [Microbacterium sp. JC 701]MCD2169019.1 hypothetical protein [Microbacterium sp. JC 701]